MRRRSRSKPIRLMTAVLVELGTMIGIIAVAQPTWTRDLIEQVTPPASQSTAGTQSPSTWVAVEQGAIPLTARALPNRFAEWQPLAQRTLPTSSSPATAWEQTEQRVARTEPTQTLPWTSYQNSSAEPVFPPPASNFIAPRTY